MASRRSKTQLSVESLEDRALCGSFFQPTGVEQLFLELLNVARSDPAAYGQSIGLDLSGVAPSEPLAFNLHLIEAARLHSQDMNQNGYFGHCDAANPACTPNPDGSRYHPNPGDRIDAASYPWRGYGESLAAGSSYPSPADALRALIIDEGHADLGHRKHLLAIDAISATLPEVGVGIVQGGAGIYRNYYTVDSARDFDCDLDSGICDPHDAFLTGVIYGDLDGDNFYSPGEGYGSVTVRAVGDGVDVSVTSFCSGGYSLPLPPGTYTVTVSGANFPGEQMVTDVAIGSNNVKLDFTTDGTDAGTGCASQSGFSTAIQLAVVSAGVWQIDANSNGRWDGPEGGDRSVRFGKSKDVPVPIDWNGDGTKDLAVFRKGKKLITDANGSARLDRAPADAVLVLGNGGDQPVIGNWSPGAGDEIGVLRNEDSTFHLDTNGDLVLDGSDARFVFTPLERGDVAIVGDWNGDGVDDVGLFRGGNTFMLDSNGNRTWEPGIDRQVTVGLAFVRPASADYDGDGTTDLAYFSQDTFYIDIDHSGSFETVIPFRAGATPVPGNWA